MIFGIYTLSTTLVILVLASLVGMATLFVKATSRHSWRHFVFGLVLAGATAMLLVLAGIWFSKNYY